MGWIDERGAIGLVGSVILRCLVRFLLRLRNLGMAETMGVIMGWCRNGNFM